MFFGREYGALSESRTPGGVFRLLAGEETKNTAMPWIAELTQAEQGARIALWTVLSRQRCRPPSVMGTGPDSNGAIVPERKHRRPTFP